MRFLVSIPRGAVKSVWLEKGAGKGHGFQFQEVQLKVQNGE